MTVTRYQHIPDTEEGHELATGLLLLALDQRHPVTVGFEETRKEKRPPKRGDGPAAWYPVKGQYVPTVRTLELFDVDEVLPGLGSKAEPGIYFTGLDRCPRDPDNWEAHGKPAIRRVRVDRITSVTVHKQLSYRLQNEHFIRAVREHAIATGRRSVSTLTDDAIWSMISLATDTDDAIKRAGLPTRT